MERSGTTCGVIASELLKKRAQEGLSPGSVKREQRLMEKDVASIADLRIADISAAVLLSALRKLGFDGDTMTGHGFRAMALTVLDKVLGFRPEGTKPGRGVLSAGNVVP